MAINIKPAQQYDVDIIFDIKAYIIENHLSREELSDKGVTGQIVAI